MLDTILHKRCSAYYATDSPSFTDLFSLI